MPLAFKNKREFNCSCAALNSAEISNEKQTLLSCLYEKWIFSGFSATIDPQEKCKYT